MEERGRRRGAEGGAVERDLRRGQEEEEEGQEGAGQGEEQQQQQ